MQKETLLVSACLLDIPCRYDGKASENTLKQREIEALNCLLIPVCPEQLSGLPTPRKPVEIQGGDGKDVLGQRAQVVSEDGKDFTAEFVSGAWIVYSIAQTNGATKMITQPRSPSCSSKCIYDGTFSHNLKAGMGVCAALLNKMGIELIERNEQTLNNITG